MREHAGRHGKATEETQRPHAHAWRLGLLTSAHPAELRKDELEVRGISLNKLARPNDSTRSLKGRIVFTMPRLVFADSSAGFSCCAKLEAGYFTCGVAGELDLVSVGAGGE